MADIDSVSGMMTESRHFYDVIKNDPAAYNVSAEHSTQLRDFVEATEASLAKRTATENLLITDRAAFKSDFGNLSPFFRKLRQTVKENPATTDVQRAELHLDTAGGDGGDDDGMETAPLLAGEISGIHQLIIRFFMAGAKSTSTKKPKRALGAKLMMKMGGEASTNLKEYQMITLDTKSPYLFEFDAEDVGKNAHIIALWVDKEDNESPQSEVFSTVIT